MSETTRTTLRLMKLHQQQRAKITSLTGQVVRSARARAEEVVRKASVGDGQERPIEILDDEPWPALSVAAELVCDLAPPELEAVLMQLPAELRDDLTDRLYSFDALSRLEDRSIQRVLAHVEGRAQGPWRAAVSGCRNGLPARGGRR